MSVATTNNRVEATGNGATTAFPVSFVFNDSTDLKVYQDDTLKTLTTHYTVSGGDGATGTVTFLAAPANGDAIIILRDPPKTQARSFRNQGRFFAEVHEQAFDKLTMLVQRLGDLLTRAAVLPDTVASTVDPTLPTPSAGGVLSWNSTADGLENGTTVGEINGAAGSAAAAAASATAAQTAQTAAELAETNAETAETNAEAAAAAAQAAADSIGFRDVIFLTSADSPYSVLQATSGKLLSIDTSGGAVTVTLPAIAGLTLPFTVGVKKTTGDANAVTINRSSTDEFDDGSTSKTLSSIAGTTLIPDTDPAPDKWSASDWGASTGQQKKQQFTDGVGFTAGVSTTITITETPLPSTDDALEIFFDGAYQQESEWSYVAATGVVTFGVAIPGGTAKVETVWATPLTIGTPADGTVVTGKLADGALSADTTGRAKMADGYVTPVKLESTAKPGKLLDIDAAVAANALTITINPFTADFRSTTLTDGTPVSRTLSAAATVVVPNTATLGTINGQASRLAVLAIDNAGTIEVAVVNLAGGNQLDETNLITTTTIGTGADSNNVVYSTTGRTNVAYRVVGFIDITEATAGTWATAPTLVQGTGGQVKVVSTSMVRVYTANGYGSTNTRIRRFTTVANNQGSDITYSDSATLGASFTINVGGVYAISYADGFNAASANGISLNSTQLTTNVSAILDADALCVFNTSGANATGLAQWTGYLSAGSIIRAHANGAASGAPLATFTITRVG